MPDYYKPVEVKNALPAGSNNIGKIDLEHTKTTMSTGNSTTTPLGIGGVFTGASEEIKDFASVHVCVFADQDSAVYGLQVQWSCDEVNWNLEETFNITANKIRQHEFGIRGRYFRVIYTNGATAQSDFRVEVAYHTVRSQEQMRSLRKDIESTDIVATKRAVLAAQKPGGGDYTNIQCTTAGNLKTAVEEFDASLPAGTNNIGDVDIVTMPNVTIGTALPAGTNNIGDVDVLSLPALPAGANTIGKVAVRYGSYDMRVKSGGHAYVTQEGISLSTGDGQGNSVRMPEDSVGHGLQSLVRPFIYNGSSWDRLRGTIANGLDVDVTRLPALVAGSATIGKVDLNPLGSCVSGQTTVTTAGTAVVLKSSTAIKSVTIKALSTNTGLIYVGDSGVSSANGFELEAGDSISLDIDNTVDIYIDSSVSGEKVSFIYVI